MDYEYDAYLHLSFYKYEPILMEKNQSSYFKLCMCPPIEVEYFFTIKGNQIINKANSMKKNESPYLKVV